MRLLTSILFGSLIWITTINSTVRFDLASLNNNKDAYKIVSEKGTEIYKSIPMQDLKIEETEETKKVVNKIIFVGDSRTVGMELAVNEQKNCSFVSKEGKGFVWFKNEGLMQVNEIMLDDPEADWSIVCNLGVNDLANVDNYIALYQSLLKDDWSDVNFFIESVNPVDESKCKTVSNKGISDFNKKISKEFNMIDTYNYILDTFSAPDGLHYNKSTYTEIYEYCMSEVYKS